MMRVIMMTRVTNTETERGDNTGYYYNWNMTAITPSQATLLWNTAVMRQRIAVNDPLLKQRERQGAEREPVVKSDCVIIIQLDHSTAINIANFRLLESFHFVSDNWQPRFCAKMSTLFSKWDFKFQKGIYYSLKHFQYFQDFLVMRLSQTGRGQTSS